MSQSLFDKDTVDKNAWHLQGNWGPVKKELESSELVVKGKIPEDLNGLYVRNGLNPRSGYSDHWVLVMECYMGLNLKTVR